jgi:hypothetical protein
MDIKLSNKLVASILTNIDKGLVGGLGKPVPGHMCVEAAICYSLGLPHGDDPKCVSSAVRGLKIALNDASWSSKAARAAGMRRLAIAQLGTNINFDDFEFAVCVSIMTVNTVVADIMARMGLPKEEKKCKAASTIKIAWGAAKSAESAARGAESAAESAAWSAARSAKSAWSAARGAAWGAARSAAESAAWGAAWRAESAAKDKILSQFAENVVQILIKMEVPAVKYLPPL